MSDMPGIILLADDEPAFRRLAATWLEGLGHRVITAGDAVDAVAQYAANQPEAVVLDLVMPPHLTPQGGVDLIAAFGATPVIVLTAHAEQDVALQAMARGAWDFLAKPVEPELLRFAADRAIRQSRLRQELIALRAGAETNSEDLGLIGRSEAMQRLREMIRRLGPAPLPVVVLGPTGTGKELVARALHLRSGRKSFVALHCGALPAELLESELFGHRKGSFTGAHRDQPGLVEAAHRGTLFLDEIGEMPLAMQVKLLRFLQDGSYMPVGAREPHRADVRVIAATHRDLDAMVAEGTFREDLFYRIRGFVLRTPSLAERREDVALLANVFLRRASPTGRLTAQAIAWLEARDWHGNVRELRALMETAAALTIPGDAIDAALLRFAKGEPDAAASESLGKLDFAIAALETSMLRQALSDTGGNQSEAARRLGISRVGLIKKLARLNLR